MLSTEVSVLLRIALESMAGNTIFGLFLNLYRCFTFSLLFVTSLAKIMVKCQIIVGGGAEEFEDAWRRADKRELDLNHIREVATSTTAN